MESAELPFVDAKDAITGDYDPERRCVKMSCGHAVDRESLTSWLRAKLADDQGLQEAFSCPAVESCAYVWPYWEVRRVALLTDDEKKEIELKLSELAARKTMDVKECPSCRSYLARKDRGSYRVVCKVCTNTLGYEYAFCWNCEKKWSSDSTSLKCGQSDCSHPLLSVVRDCELKVTINGVSFPARRACPRCGVIVEHNGQGCKNISCPKCNDSFCMCCLLAKSCGSNCTAAAQQAVIPSQ